MLTDHLLYFLAASVVLSVAPGPDNLFVVTVGMTHGRRPALAAAWGMCSGLTVHSAAAALGISALLYSSSWAFHAVRFAGAGYLLYLSWRTLHGQSPALTAHAAKQRPGPTLFRRGLMMNLLNPKVALFFLAFLPQFALPERGNVAVQMLFLGFLFTVQAVAVFTGIAVFSGTVGNRLLRSTSFAATMRWVAGGVLAALGIQLALISR